MNSGQGRAVGFGVVVHLARFAVMVIALEVAALLGVSGWSLGLVANLACTVFAVVLVTRLGLWRVSGLLRGWAGPRAALLLLPLLGEVLLWALPHGLVAEPPGYGWWALTLLLVGLNEELISRVVVLERQRQEFAALPAVTITAALFGLQHLAALVTTGRALDDVLLNVLVSGCYGFALASFQYRFRWVAPLVLLHAAVDFTSILAVRTLSDLAIGATVVMFLGWGVLVLRGDPAARVNPHQPQSAVSAGT